MSSTRRRTTYTNGSTYALQTEEAGKRLVPKAPGDGTQGCPRSRGGSRAQRIAPLRQRAEAARPSALPAIADLTETASFVKTAATPTKHSSTTTNVPRTCAQTCSTNSKYHLTSPRTRMRSVTRSQQPRPSATNLSVYRQSPRSRGPSRGTGERRRLCTACRHTIADKKAARKLAFGSIRRYPPDTGR
jgi:hypothetical protein